MSVISRTLRNGHITFHLGIAAPPARLAREPIGANRNGLDFSLSVIAYVFRRLCLAGRSWWRCRWRGLSALASPSIPPISLVADPSKRAFVRAYYHLNDPILSQYWRWVRGLFSHGFGTTVSTDVTGTVPPQLGSPGAPIGPAVWHAAAITFELVGAALVFVIVGSMVVAAVSARRRRFRTDLAARSLAYLGAAVPTFLVGDLLVHAINPHYAQVLVGGHATVTSTGSWFVVGPPTGGFVNWLQHMTLPVVALAVSLIGIYARYLRSAIVSTLSEPYVAVARAKGLSERQLMLHHVLRNSLIPFTSLLSLEIGAVIGASLAADAVFNLGGLASTFLGAVNSADPFELTALFVTTAVVVSAFALLGDVLVGLLDPRVSVRQLERRVERVVERVAEKRDRHQERRPARAPGRRRATTAARARPARSATGPRSIGSRPPRVLPASGSRRYRSYSRGN